MIDFKIRKHIRSKDDGVNDYIEALEKYITSLKASNTNTLIFKLDELNGTISEDVQKIIDGESIEYVEVEYKDKDTGELCTKEVSRSTLKVLNDDRDSKVFDRVMTLYGKLKDLKSVSDYVSSLIPDIIEEEELVKKVIIERGTNPMEQILKQIPKK